MALKSGLAAQIGWALETTPGTAVTVTSFTPFVSENIAQEIERIESDAIITGRRILDSDQWSPGSISVGGDVQLELFNRGLGKLFKLMMGGSATTGVGPYTHTFTPGDLSGVSATIQAGRPSTDGTVNPFTWSGCKVASWEIACSVGEIATLGLTISGMTEVTNVALATAAYPGTMPKGLVFTGGSVTLAGSAHKVKSLTLSGENGLDEDRRFIGTAARFEPLEAALRRYEGSLECEFENLTAYNRFVNGTEAALVLAFSNGTDSVTITTNVRFDGESPSVGGKEILSQNLPYVCVGDGTDNSAITIVVVNSDATI